MGILAAGERAIATTNRNFVGRMGDPTSEVYLSSPAVAAASAVLGHIGLPEDLPAVEKPKTATRKATSHKAPGAVSEPSGHTAIKEPVGSFELDAISFDSTGAAASSDDADMLNISGNMQTGGVSMDWSMLED